MSIREALNKYRSAGMAVAMILCAGAAILLYRQIASGRESLALKQGYFTGDDGQTWFIDDINHVPPFEKEGKQVVRAYLFKNGEEGKPFVGYLERFKDASRSKMIEIMSRPLAQRKTEEVQAIVVTGREVKKPGTATWADANSRQGIMIATPVLPNGQSGVVEAMFP